MRCKLCGAKKKDVVEGIVEVLDGSLTMKEKSLLKLLDETYPNPLVHNTRSPMFQLRDANVFEGLLIKGLIEKTEIYQSGSYKAIGKVKWVRKEENG